MPKAKQSSDDFRPIEVVVGETTPPVVSEVDFRTSDQPATRKPRSAATTKEH